MDVHAFTPGGARGSAARRAASSDVRVSGEELAARWFGWANRTLEATAEPDDVPWAWRRYAYRGYLRCRRSTARCSSRGCRPAIFYNLLISRAAARRRS